MAEKIERGEHYILVQERRKHPYFGFWGFPSGKIRWGETILQTAARELHEETGLTGVCKHRGIYHEHAVEQESGLLLEDKIFHIIHCSSLNGQLQSDFDGGHNEWMTLSSSNKLAKRFASFAIEATMGLGLNRKRFVEASQYVPKQQF